MKEVVKKYNHKRDSASMACGITLRSIRAHEQAMARDLKNYKTGKKGMPISFRVEMLEKHFTKRELAFLLEQLRMNFEEMPPIMMVVPSGVRPHTKRSVDDPMIG